MKQRNWALLPLDWLLLSGAVLAVMYCLKSAFQFTVSPLLAVWVVLFVGVLSVLLRLPKPGLWALGVLVLGLAAAWIFRAWLLADLGSMYRYLIGRLVEAYPFLSPLAVIHGDPELPGELTAGFFLLAGLLSYLVCLFTVWLRTTAPTVLSCALFVAPCFFLTTTQPQIGALVLLCACLLVLLFSSGVRDRAPREAATATLWALLPAAAALGLLLWLFPAERYERPIKLETLTEQVERIGDWMSGNTSGGGSQGVDLRTLGPKQQRTTQVFGVTATSWDPSLPEQMPRLYLRGSAYTEFKNDSWRLGEIPAWTGEDSPLDRSDLDGLRYSLDVYPRRAYPLLYTPDYPAGLSCPTVFDYRIPNTEGQAEAYSFDGVLPSDEQPLHDSQCMRALADDAYGKCLALPERTRDALRALAQAQGIPLTPGSSCEERSAAVQTIIDYVQDGAVYTINPKKVESGEDFCTWFLREDGGNKRGYCIHYATVTAALCRAVGIPARYVEGYVTELLVTTLDEGRVVGTANVQERQAHAWVEVFYDGVGWMRVDPTPASGVAQTAAAASNQTPETDEATEEATAPTRGEPETTETPTQESTEPIATDEPETTETEQTRQTSPLWWLLTLLLIPPLLWLLRTLRQRRRREKEAALSGNALALWRWRRYLRLCRAGKQTPDEALYELAQKARFSQHTLDEMEQARLCAGIETAAAAVRTLPAPRRWWYVYWLQ